MDNKSFARIAVWILVAVVLFTVFRQFETNSTQSLDTTSYTQFMDDANPRERDLALFMDIVLLTKCAELWVFGDTVSKGMSIEIEKARRKGQTIRYFTENCQEVSV